MLAQRNIDISTISNLEIVHGDVKDVVAVKKVLQFQDGELDVIVCGIGTLIQPTQVSRQNGSLDANDKQVFQPQA